MQVLNTEILFESKVRTLLVICVIKEKCKLGKKKECKTSWSYSRLLLRQSEVGSFFPIIPASSIHACRVLLLSMGWPYF
jgi:hypothetical protein